MATVYILYSESLGKFYIGSCLDFGIRMADHSSGVDKTSFTNKAKDWEVFFRKDELSYEQARGIERHIKKMKSKKYIMNLTQYPEMIEKLISKYQ